MSHRSKKFRPIRALILLAISGIFIIAGCASLWVATLKMPDLNTFVSRKISQSTKIYDRTGTVLLYDVNTDVKRTVVLLSGISPLIQKATVAIEDSDFYTHFGIRPTAIIRAAIADITSGGASQGGSTITQQVVKNSLLTQDKTITRKIKEWVLAIKLEKIMSKDQILEAYLNETAYGGTLYGVEEACQAFFGKPAVDISLAQAAYIAAIPQAPTYFSPYGTHRDALNTRQKLVLQRMKDLGLISNKDYTTAINEKVVFLSRNSSAIRAPHFVMMVKDYLSQKYGDDVVNGGGLKVTTTLNYDMQQKAEQVVTKFGPALMQNYNASNTAIVAIDPKTGDILTMVGSRDYFDDSIDGNYNIALAKRQPGSTFKPFVYSTAFKKGYTPETVLFDAKTEFSTKCNPDGTPKNSSDDPKKVCYSPVEYDEVFEGPLSIRQALAQSRNIPAVKALYLAGISDSIQTAQDMGITTLTDPNRYGLTLVLGGGEVSLLDLTSAYGVFANDGVRNPYRSVLKVEDGSGNILEQASLNPVQVVDATVVRQISSILSDTGVRMASLKPIGESVGRTVAIKTGTTNDYRDVWTLGYTPNLVVGAWAGNNDNIPMKHNVAGLIISPLWGAFMSQVARNFPPEEFKAPPQPVTDNKPVLHGVWQGGISYWKDKVSGKVATEYTPQELKQEVVFNDVHTILQWVNKDDPNGPIPTNPDNDSQYKYWEYGVRNWLSEYEKTHPDFKEVTDIKIPTEKDDVHTPDKAPLVTILTPTSTAMIDPNQLLNVQLAVRSMNQPQKTEVYINGKYILTAMTNPLNFSFMPADSDNLTDNNTLSVILYDTALNKGQAIVNFTVKK
ncbi:MAG: transglycosylase domain-containing protein [Candidatus Taylorbacteria bacterium]|nr:transglycosylase domain-containing protein [Candidatus Taylorbacteria bacterium]